MMPVYPLFSREDCCFAAWPSRRVEGMQVTAQVEELSAFGSYQAAGSSYWQGVWAMYHPYLLCLLKAMPLKRAWHQSLCPSPTPA